MYIVINAIKNVKRNMSRNVLVLIILALVIVGSVVALSIKSATAAISEEYRNSLGAEATITVNEAKFKNAKSNPMVITMDHFNKLAESELVRSYKLSTSMAVEGDNLKGKDAEEIDSEASKNTAMVGVGDDGKPKEFDNLPSIKLLGSTSTAGYPFADFKNGKRVLTDGREVEKAGEGLISQEFAEINKLKVGDVLKLRNPVKESSGTLEITVVGIYKDTTTEYPESTTKASYSNRRNEILTTFETTKNFYNTDSANINADFSLRSPEDLKAFEQLARDIGITDDYLISVDEAAYNKAVGPLETLSTIMTYFIVVMLVVSGGVLLLLSILSIKERQFEIGVLRAMGMKKIAVAFGFLTESIIILIISLLIGVSLGSLIANPVANDLLQQQIETIQNAKPAAGSKGNINSTVKDNKEEVDAIDKIETTINYLVILQIAGIGLLLVLVSNGAAISYIMKFEPIEIMRKRD